MLSVRPTSMMWEASYTIGISFCQTGRADITEGLDKDGGPVGNRVDGGYLEPRHGV